MLFLHYSIKLVTCKQIGNKLICTHSSNAREQCPTATASPCLCPTGQSARKRSSGIIRLGCRSVMAHLPVTAEVMIRRREGLSLGCGEQSGNPSYESRSRGGGIPSKHSCAAKPIAEQTQTCRWRDFSWAYGCSVRIRDKQRQSFRCMRRPPEDVFTPYIDV